jgi:hypothetical protein
MIRLSTRESHNVLQNAREVEESYIKGRKMRGLERDMRRELSLKIEFAS